ncbi:MAG TPA: hypothetical protein P5552_02510 [Candidatus Competibacteraceae bacterium]|nr:hypothetical protein [Candidatus Competibacteraceae bacterium]
MPEITSVETIRAKLREFDERMDGAISAAKTLRNIKVDAEKILADIQGVSTKSELLLKKIEYAESEFKKSQQNWQTLKQEVEDSLAKSSDTRDSLHSELNKTIKLIEEKLLESEKNLKEKNKELLMEQADLLKQLDGSTRENAKIAMDAKGVVVEKTEALNKILDTIQDQLQIEIRTKLFDAEKQIDLNFKEIESKIEQRIDSFKQEMKSDLSKHQQAIDHQLTQFLNRQNALIHNLTQQIDGYSRVSQAQAAEISVLNSRLTELLPLKPLLNQARIELANQEERLAKVEFLFQIVANQDEKLAKEAIRLDEVLEKLKKSFFIGGKFK